MIDIILKLSLVAVEEPLSAGADILPGCVLSGGTLSESQLLAEIVIE